MNLGAQLKLPAAAPKRGSLALYVIALVSTSLLPTHLHAQAGCIYGGNSGIPRGCPVGGPPAGPRPHVGNPSNTDAEEERKNAQYNQLWQQAGAAFKAGNYALALQLYEQALTLRDGPATRANIALVKGLMAWSSDPRAALAYFQERRRYLDQYDAPETTALKASNDQLIATLQGYLTKQDQAARDQAKAANDVQHAAAEIARARSDAERAAAVAEQHGAQDIAVADRKMAAFGAVGAAADGDFARAKAAVGDLTDAEGGAIVPGGRVVKATQIGAAASVKGDVFIENVPGKRVKLASGDPVASNAHVFTGANGRVQLLLADKTTFVIGPGSDMVLDEFVYDTDQSSGKVMADVAKGVFRFITAKVVGTPRGEKVVLPAGSLGIRGTDVEAYVASDGSGWVKLHSGAAVVMPKAGGAEKPLAAGQMVTFDAGGKVSAPVPLNPSTGPAVAFDE